MKILIFNVVQHPLFCRLYEVSFSLNTGILLRHHVLARSCRYILSALQYLMSHLRCRTENARKCSCKNIDQMFEINSVWLLIDENRVYKALTLDGTTVTLEVSRVVMVTLQTSRTVIVRLTSIWNQTNRRLQRSSKSMLVWMTPGKWDEHFPQLKRDWSNLQWASHTTLNTSQ